MYEIKNFLNNDDIKVINKLGAFTVIEYQRDLSVMPSESLIAYYCNAMNVRKRQVICDLSQSDIILQAGAMQWTVGNVNATTGVKGVGDLRESHPRQCDRRICYQTRIHRQRDSGTRTDIQAYSARRSGRLERLDCTGRRFVPCL